MRSSPRARDWRAWRVFSLRVPTAQMGLFRKNGLLSIAEGPSRIVIRACYVGTYLQPNIRRRTVTKQRFARQLHARSFRWGQRLPWRFSVLCRRSICAREPLPVPWSIGCMFPFLDGRAAQASRWPHAAVQRTSIGGETSRRAVTVLLIPRRVGCVRSDHSRQSQPPHAATMSPWLVCN